MARCLSGWLKNESIFYRILTVETASQHQLQSNLTGEWLGIYHPWHQSDYPWHQSVNCDSKIKDFYHRKARIHSDSALLKKDFERKIQKLRRFLENKGLCMRHEYTGSVYEKLNICSDVLEFDVMFVRDGNCMKSITKTPGYAMLEPEDNMYDLHKYNDDDGYLDPEKYYSFFKGVVTKWLNIMNDASIVLRQHGVAIQLDVLNNKSIWYHVDIVPCFEIGSALYVPKPDSDVSPKPWRLSYSLQERQKLKSSATESENHQRECIRIVKAIFKHQTSNFNSFTSYHIKTVMLHSIAKKMLFSTNDRLGYCVMLFLHEIEEFLKPSGKLNHYFEPSIDLLKNVRPVQKENMARCLSGWLKNESIFYRILTDETASQLQLQSNSTGVRPIRELAERFDYENVSNGEDHDQVQDSGHGASIISIATVAAAVGVGIVGLTLYDYFSRRVEDDEE